MSAPGTKPSTTRSTSIDGVLRAATSRLNDVFDDPGGARLDAEVLLTHVLGISRTRLFVQLPETMEAKRIAAFEALIEQRVRGLPVAYLTEECEFYSLPFRVTSAVLVPRPETELIVEHVIAHAQPGERVLDLGTGSGAIAIAIAMNRPDLTVTATDVSHSALELARTNAENLNARRIRFEQGHWYAALHDEKPSAFNWIVSNPPYIAKDDAALDSPGVRAEPIAALVSGTDGLTDLFEIIDGAIHHLSSDGRLVVEHGHQQGADVRDRMQRRGFMQCRTITDLAGHERVSVGNVVKDDEGK